MKLGTALIIAPTMMILAGTGNAAATPFRPAINPAGAAPGQGPTGWQSICRERTITRRDQHGRLITFQAPSCSQVWIGKRYYSNGVFYADPAFREPLY